MQNTVLSYSTREQNPLPLLVSRFEIIRQKPEVDLVVTDLPQFFESLEYRQYCFEETRKSWVFSFNDKMILECLQSEPKDDNLLYLKKVRRFGLILKALFKFFSLNHQCPEHLHFFLKNLGVYNDYYGFPSSRTWAKAILDKNILGLVVKNLSISHGSTIDFQLYARFLLSKMNEMVKEHMTITDFHSLRRKFRLFGNLYQVPAAGNVGNLQHALFYQIFYVSNYLGKLHDDFVQRGIRDEIDYSRSSIKLSNDVVRLKALLPFIAKTIG